MLILLCVLAIALIGVTVQSSAENYSVTRLLYDECTIEVAGVNSFYTKVIQVTQDTDHRYDSAHQIDYYLVAADCKELNTSQKTENITGTNMQDANFVHYLLPQSIIWYNVCASMNTSITSPVTVDLMVFDDLKRARDDNPNNDDFVAYHHFPVGDGSMDCENYSYHVEKAAYYITKFAIPENTNAIAFEFEYVVHKLYIDLEKAELSSNCTTEANGDTCVFKLYHALQHNCLIANISPRTHPGQYHYVHNAITLKPQMEDPKHWMPVVGFILVLFAVLSLVGIGFAWSKCRQ